MKNVLIILSLLFSQLAISAPACYQVSAPTYDFIPQELCFEFVYLDTTREEVILKETSGKLPTHLFPHYVARRNENGYRFIAQYQILNHWPGGCEEGKTLRLVIEGRSDNDGYVENTNLIIKAQYEHAWDSCHSRVSTSEVNYTLK